MVSHFGAAVVERTSSGHALEDDGEAAASVMRCETASRSIRAEIYCSGFYVMSMVVI
jgi:hypothetical protein